MMNVLNDWLGNWSGALIAFALAQVADVVTTNRALDRGGREANPLVAALIERLGGNGWVVAKLAVAGSGGALIYWAGAPWMLWGLAGLTGAIAWHNGSVGR